MVLHGFTGFYSCYCQKVTGKGVENEKNLKKATAFFSGSGRISETANRKILIKLTGT